MAKTTATVTVGADTRPFERKMRSLGGGLGGGGGGGGGILSGMFRSATSALGAGLGLGAAFLGVKGAQSAFDLAKALSPEFAGAMNTISVLLQDSIKPAITTLGKALQRFMPTIETALGTFGRMLDDVVKFWTEDALNPEVWKDIGRMIVEGIKETFELNALEAKAMETAKDLATDPDVVRAVVPFVKPFVNLEEAGSL